MLQRSSCCLSATNGCKVRFQQYGKEQNSESDQKAQIGFDRSQSVNDPERVKRRGMDDSYMIKTNCSRVDVWVILRRFEALSTLNGILKSGDM